MSYYDNNVGDNLENYIKNYKIFIDTCSLLEDSADQFWGNVKILLKKHNNKIIVATRVIEELQKHSMNRKDVSLANKANRALSRMSQYINDGLVDIRGEASDSYLADNVFLVLFTKFRMQYNLLLITQDNNLAKDILALNNSKSVRAKTVDVKRIEDGKLVNFRWDSKKSEDQKTRPQESKNAIVNQAFKSSCQLTGISDVKIKISCVPIEGDVLKSKTGNVRLLKQLDHGEGGEAKVFYTDTPYIAKIYKDGQITERKKAKIELMLSKEIDYPGICYPKEILYNSQNEFVGYLMPKAEGFELAKSIFQPKLLLKKFPGWKKKDTVNLCITLLEQIKYLHDRNILLGDINPGNIMVVSPQQAYIVDTDSFQVEGFPCPVGTINYTAPEIQGKHFESFLRTKGHENFAVATLLFMLMLPGKPPYSQQGGVDPISNIVNMNFSYPLGENSNGKTPEGPWRFMWSHLPYFMKEDFYNTFSKNGTHASESTRLSADDWLENFKKYKRLLEGGKLSSQDEMSLEIFPTRFKKNRNATYIYCRLCGQETDERFCKDKICPECLKKGEVYRCQKCGREMIYTNRQKYIDKSQRYLICKDCSEESKQVYTTQTCTVCGKKFDISRKDAEYYKRKGYEFPKRCKECREANLHPSRGVFGYGRNNSSPYNTGGWLGLIAILSVIGTIVFWIIWAMLIFTGTVFDSPLAPISFIGFAVCGIIAKIFFKGFR